ncbi:hypothetical protein OPV22_003841 [Ensete ventricosum]|uniref:Uncharacterized protein n=1 Tax=Ensete ventricosum TaxID=4639 RepID=A0AAV8S1Q2_ENSVE|nr:hypothetical protein OPV22_003841 [Ensete ventricosum]
MGGHATTSGPSRRPRQLKKRNLAGMPPFGEIRSAHEPPGTRKESPPPTRDRRADGGFLQGNPRGLLFSSNSLLNWRFRLT